MVLLRTVAITASKIQNDEIRALYETSFPVEEQIPYDDLGKLMQKMELDFTAYYLGEKFIGLTIVLNRKDFNWFWYFAVKPELRGKGYGQHILSALIEKYSDRPSVLDMESPEQEAPNSEQRKRRHRFYLRNGFRDTHVGKSFEGVDYTIMAIGNRDFTQKDYDDIIEELHSCWDNMPNEEKK